MIGNSIRQRIIVFTFLVLLLALFGSLFIASSAFNSTLRETTYTQLANQARYLSTVILNSPNALSDSEGSRLTEEIMSKLDTFSQNTHLRITLIDPTGIVLYDSDYASETLDNHLWRQEVQIALSQGTGTSERRSDTQNLPVLYHALRMDRSAEIAVLRVSTTLDQLLGYEQTYRQLFFRGLAILILIVGIFTAISIIMITKPLNRIKVVVGRYAEGDLDAPLKIDSPKELAELAATMQTMANQLKQTLTESRAQKEQLVTLLESMNEGIVLVDEQLVIRIINTAAKRFLSSDSVQIQQKMVLSHAIRSTQIIESCSQTLHDGNTHDITIAHYGHLFGETAKLAGRHATKMLKLTMVPVYQGTAINAVVITINDTTELLRLEQVRKDFVANVSHELKTPITAIAGFANLLIEESQTNTKDIEHFSSVIHRQAQNMQRIVEDLLLLSSLEQQNAKPTCMWTTIDQIFEETIEATRYKAEQKGTPIHTKVENPMELELWVNGMLIVQALANLVVNAITYSDGGKAVTISAVVKEERVIISVKDFGCGIPKEAQQRIFERFYRVDAARSRSLGGTGLGLSIVKHIVAVHGGIVSVDSNVGNGSTFTITLPRSSTELEKLQSRSDALYQRDTP